MNDLTEAIAQALADCYRDGNEIAHAPTAARYAAERVVGALTTNGWALVHLQNLTDLADELDRRAHATGKAAEPAGWLLEWEAKGVRRAIAAVSPTQKEYGRE